MTLEALQEEVETLENETVENQEESTETEEQKVEKQEEPKEELTDEQKEQLQKQEAYRERKRREAEKKSEESRQEEERIRLEQQALATEALKKEEGEKDDIEALKAQMAQYDRVVKQQQYKDSVRAAERELSGLETEFKEAFPDYQDKVDSALEFSKMNLVSQGYTELQASEYLQEQKVLIADKAAAEGKDPVEAVYQEANNILGVVENFAEKMGYKKESKKTNLQARREMSKPNAMTGGSSMSSPKLSYDEMEAEDIDNLSIGDMLAGKHK